MPLHRETYYHIPSQTETHFDKFKHHHIRSASIDKPTAVSRFIEETYTPKTYKTEEGIWSSVLESEASLIDHPVTTEHTQLPRPLLFFLHNQLLQDCNTERNVPEIVALHCPSGVYKIQNCCVDTQVQPHLTIMDVNIEEKWCEPRTYIYAHTEYSLATDQCAGVRCFNSERGVFIGL